MLNGSMKLILLFKPTGVKWIVKDVPSEYYRFNWMTATCKHSLSS